MFSLSEDWPTSFLSKAEKTSVGNIQKFSLGENFLYLLEQGKD
jgi:hypothetical protein